MASVWTQALQPFDFFSIFLSRGVLSFSTFDLSFIPIDYLEHVFHCIKTEEGRGYLNLLMMLFAEYYQAKQTGLQRIIMQESRYAEMAEQFVLFCQLELRRRSYEGTLLNQYYLFDPNLKTVFLLDKRYSSADLHIRCEHARIKIDFYK